VAQVLKLSEDIIRGIAAGEVVERPASVLKELIENALDAGARRIDVEWRDAGRKRLRVSDDGEGMIPDDARLALERHATSKIRDLNDLETVGTFGFRGEALPSIMAVSRFELVTRTAKAAEAWAIRAEAGRVLFDGPAGAPLGTSVTVDDLFFAVPARLKFLKSDATERALLFRAVEDASLAASGTAFRVLSEGKESLSLPSLEGDDSRLIERLESLWGADRARSLKMVDEAGPYMRVRGWVSDVNAPQSTARYQRFYVNRRAVSSRRLMHALYDGYRGRLLIGRHPAALLFLELDSSLVDVNVHPAKREVRLSHESEAHNFLSRAVQNAVSRSVQARAVFAPTDPSGLTVPPPVPPPRTETSSVSYRPGYTESRIPRSPSAAETHSAFALQSPLMETVRVDNASGAIPGDLSPTTEGLPLVTFRDGVFEPVSQLYSTYVLARFENQFFLFDQHAAAERVLYEVLSERAARGTPAKQALLLPWVWEPSPEASAVVQSQRADFENLGYSLEPFGGNAWRVLAVPAALGDGNKVRSLLEGLVDDLLSGKIPQGWDAILTRAACRGSVKAGDPLTLGEMSHLIKELQGVAKPWTCPHGRPTFLGLTDSDLAKRFRRV
jgi:DNA mismatch repair protein MutL